MLKERILNLIKKRLDKELIRKVVRWVKESGIDGVGFFMVGLPTETREEIMETVKEDIRPFDTPTLN